MPVNPEMFIPEDEKHRVLNAHLKVGDTDLMLSDIFPGQPDQLGSQVTVAITMFKSQKRYLKNCRMAARLRWHSKKLFGSLPMVK